MSNDNSIADVDGDEFDTILKDNGVAVYICDDGVVVGITRGKLKEFLEKTDRDNQDKIVIFIQDDTNISSAVEDVKN